MIMKSRGAGTLLGNDTWKMVAGYPGNIRKIN